MEDLPKYYKVKDGIYCPNRLKENVLKELQNRVTAPKIDTMDGLKLYFEDESWILIRPSGTEPKFRVYSEARHKKRAKALIDIHRELVKEIIDLL
jgi:phosphomannomutase/phosphoglucomutase